MNEQPTPSAVITEMKILGRLSNLENNDMIINLSKGQNVELSHAQNSFGLTFNVQNYSLVNQVEYVYMLKGLKTHGTPSMRTTASLSETFLRENMNSSSKQGYIIRNGRKKRLHLPSVSIPLFG